MLDGVRNRGDNCHFVSFVSFMLLISVAWRYEEFKTTPSLSLKVFRNSPWTDAVGQRISIVFA